MNAHCSGSEEQELQNCIWRPPIGKKLSIPLSVSFMFPPKYYFKESNSTFELYLCMCLSVWNTEAYLASAYITSRYWKTLFNKYSILTLFYILTEPLTILKVQDNVQRYPDRNVVSLFMPKWLFLRSIAALLSLLLRSIRRIGSFQDHNPFQEKEKT